MELSLQSKNSFLSCYKQREEMIQDAKLHTSDLVNYDAFLELLAKGMTDEKYISQYTGVREVDVLAMKRRMLEARKKYDGIEEK